MLAQEMEHPDSAWDKSSCLTSSRAKRNIWNKAERNNLRTSYFRAADLRGLDMRTCRLDGVSLHEAYISSVYFPDKLSVEQGTRMRYS